MTLVELEDKLPNGFHDAKVHSLELDYEPGTAKFRLSLLIGLPEDPPSTRNAYQRATLHLTGFCFCSIEPPDPNYRFLPEGKPISADGCPEGLEKVSTFHELQKVLPTGAWIYRFFLHDSNSFLHIAARNATLEWEGTPPKGSS